MSFLIDQYSIDILIRLLVATGLGAVIGFERDIHGRAAGLRTNILVSLGAALFMVISYAMVTVQIPGIKEISVSADPGRIASQIITGIGFLGAGAIIKEGFTIRGLTTAAGLWLVAGIGMASGAGFYYLATLATLIGLICLVALNLIEKLYAKDSYHSLEIVASSEVSLPDIMDVFKKRNLKVKHFMYELDHENKTLSSRFVFRFFERSLRTNSYQDLMNDFEDAKLKIKRIKWTTQ